MSNQWGDDPVSTAPTSNEWGDSVAVSGWGDTEVATAPSPYAAIIAEAQDFQRRAAANTPEAIGRQATLDVDKIAGQTRIPSLVGPGIPQWLAQPLIENAPRVGAPLGAALSISGVGTLPGLAIMGLSGLAGEIGSQAIEKEITGSRDEYSVPQMAVGGLLSAAPPLRLSGVASPLARGGLRAAEGVGYGALAPTLEAGLQGRLPTREELVMGAAAGGLLGAPFGAAEFGRGRTLGSRAQTDIPAAELEPMRRALAEPVLPAATDVMPAELGAVNQAQAISRAEQGAAAASGERAVAALDEAVDARKVRALGERMMGKSPQDQLAILDQEMRLQKDTLSVAEQRAGLDMKQELKRQIEAQKAMEEAANAQQKAAADAQKAQADAQKAATEAMKPPEMPKSAQILADPVSKPPALANVATEVATQTKNSPYALQGKLNEMTAVPEMPAALTPAPLDAPVAQGRPPVEMDAATIRKDRAEYDRLQAQMKKIGFDKVGTDEFNAAWQASEDIKNRHGGMPPQTVAAEPAAPQKPPETRGLGVQYHGASKPFDLTPGGSYGGSEMNILGSGLYTTDALDVASSYQKKNRAKGEQAQPTVYQITEKAPVKFFDLNAPISDDVLAITGIKDGSAHDFVMEAYEGIEGQKTLGRLFSEMRGISREYNMPAYEVQAFFDDWAIALAEKGYGGWRDVGGLAAGRGKVKPHDVKVYWFPENQVDLVVKNPLEKPTNALQKQTAGEGVLRAETERPNLDVELPRVASRDAQPEGVAGQAAPEALSEAQFLAQQAGDAPPTSGRDPSATRAASVRRGQRGAIPSQVLTPAATGVAGGAVGFTATEREPGETDEQFQARRLRNTAIGIAAGGALGVSAISAAAKTRKSASRPQPRGTAVDLPQTGPGEGIRRTAEKVILNDSYPQQLRETLAEDPEIIYNKISRNELKARVKSSTDAELQALLASPDQNLRVSALAELGNRAAVTPGMEAEGARLHRELAKNFTKPAQLLGLGSLVESPQAMVDAVEETLKLSVPRGKPAPTLTPAVKAKLFDLSKRSIQAEQAFDRTKGAAIRDFTDANVAAYRKAELEMGAARRELAAYTKDILPERYGEIVSKIIKGNLLAPLSFAKNAFGNAAWQSLLRGSEAIASGLDGLYAVSRGKPRTIKLGNPLPTADELAAFYDGVKIASKEMLTGPGAESYIKAEVQRGFHPVRAMVQTLSGIPAAERFMERRGIAPLPRTPDGKILVNDRIKKIMEGFLGPFPEASFRFLNLGDKPVRRAVETRILNEQADIRGLTGVEREKFMMFPDAKTEELVSREGLGGVLAQDNKLATKVGKIFDTGLVDIAEAMGGGRPEWLEDVNKVMGTLAIPYRQFPANFAITAMNFAVPPVAFARATAQAVKGNRREALRNYGEGLIGAMALGAAGYLWKNGLISEPADPKDKKRRSAQYESMGAQRLNVSGLERLQAGGDPTYRYGDRTIDWSATGPIAASLYVYTKSKAKDAKAAARTGDPVEQKTELDALLNVADAAGFAFDQSFLAGTSAIIDAVKDWENYGDKVIQNLFRAITSTVAPASLESIARTQYPFIPEQKGDSMTETLKNVWNYKTMQLSEDERKNYKRDMWGEPVKRTPEGQNPYIAQFIDVTKSEKKTPDPMKQALLELYQQTNSTDAYPALVNRNFSENGVTVTLNADDYDILQDFAGQARENLARRWTADPRFSDPKLTPEQKMIVLQRVYELGLRQAQQALKQTAGFYDRYPELRGEQVPLGQESRLLSRDLKARSRLRQGQ